MVGSDNKKWFALALIFAVQFMTILDIAIVNVALPSIQLDLGFSQENLQWVISAYALVFGGFLLLGGRSADLLGRRRIFMAGTLDLHARVAAVRARLERGVADRVPRAAGPRRRDALAGRALDPRRDVRRGSRAQHRAGRLGRRRRLSGAAAGVLFGGVLVDFLSWEWIFFVNVPVGRRRADPRADPALGEPRQARPGLRRSGGRARHVGSLAARSRDHAGQRVGLGLGRTIGVFVAAAVLLLAFIGWERRARIRWCRSRSSGCRR